MTPVGQDEILLTHFARIPTLHKFHLAIICESLIPEGGTRLLYCVNPVLCCACNFWSLSWCTYRKLSHAYCHRWVEWNIFCSNSVFHNLHFNKKCEVVQIKKLFFFFWTPLYCIIVKKMNILFYKVFAVLHNNMNNNISTDIRPIWFDPSDPKWTVDCSVNIVSL